FSPPAVLVGHHQVVVQEARVDWCRDHGVDVNRRLTGGGAIYFDSTQIGWELVGATTDFEGIDMTGLTRTVCEAAATGLRELGVAAEFRPRNDIEVDGRKISGTGGVADDGIFLYQGTVLVEFDIEAMLLALRIPTEKLTPRGLETARDRVTCLSDLLTEVPTAQAIREALTGSFAEALGAEFAPGGLSHSELERLEEKLPEFESDDWIHSISAPDGEKQIYSSIHKRPGGMLRVHAAVDVKRSWLRQVLITGDFFINPRRAIMDLEAELMNTPFPEVRGTITRFFDQNQVDLVGLTPADFCDAVKLALEQTSYNRIGISEGDASSVYPVNVPEGSSIEQVMSDASVLLLPYCAKLPDCEYRFTQGCDECGMCTIGDAYGMAKEKNLEAITIVKFEHLKETLAGMKAQGVKSWIGCACEPFFIKRNEAFRDAGIPGVILDIVGKTCYNLGEEGKAYAGTFEAQADLKLPLLEAVMGNVNPCHGTCFIPSKTPEADTDQRVVAKGGVVE
ncbi:MAG TPA: DUF116 domain-containing protein, partial [Candidatus Thalassarchaeaceae archaeon]|nr:DUF116 domain-containing protein [Candidatus Thalassarchaeaceae archaeon]